MTDDEMRSLVRKLAELNGLPVSDMVETVIEGREPEELAEDATEEKGPVRPRRKGVWLTLGLVGGVFGICIVLLLNYVNGTVSAGPDQSKVLGDAKSSMSPSPPALHTISGLHIAFAYPQVFTDSRPVRDIKAGLEGYILIQPGLSSSQIAISVEKLPSGQLDDESGYKWRTAVSQDYGRAQPTQVQGEPAEIVAKKDGSERTLYWAHGGMVVIVAVTATSGSGDLAAYLKTVQDSLRWLG